MKAGTSNRSHVRAAWLVVVLAGFFFASPALGQADKAPEAPAATAAQPDAPSDQDAAAPAPDDPTRYGWMVMIPALVAILLAIFTRQVIPALVVGILVGSYMLLPFLPAVAPGSNSFIRGLRVSAEHYVLGAIHDPSSDYGHLKIMVFTLVIGFMVGVIGKNGGTAGLVHFVAGDTQSKTRGTLTAWLAGLVVFFDDYANSMIVGPTMRPIFDRLRVSRAKLAYIVDSTAAPVASLALIGTWVGAEIQYIKTGLDGLGTKPDFLVNVNEMQAFIQSLPYRFYPLLALFLVFIVCLLGRDFGPMKAAERRAAAGEVPKNAAVRNEAEGPRPQAWLGLLPILVLVGVTIGILCYTGYYHPNTQVTWELATGETISQWELMPKWEQASLIVGNSDAYISILYGALAAATAAVLLTMLARVASVKAAVDAGLEGMSRMFPAVVILILAWAISQVSQDLMLGTVVADRLQAMNVPAHWMPLGIFVAAAVISFATGTSWGTMGILCPITVTVTVPLIVSANLPAAEAASLFYAAIGSVLAGAIFGDHCSPISDTTVLSSLASSCPHEEHVWTQIPYALLAAFAAMGCGDFLSSRMGQPWYVGLTAGAVFLFLFLMIFGRRVRPEDVSATPGTLLAEGPNPAVVARSIRALSEATRGHEDEEEEPPAERTEDNLDWR